jgi:uncharacterized protein YndB with AHSA1/START domain
VTEPLTLSFDVECAPRHAFDVWTNRFGQWWPRGHTVSGDPETIVLEPHVGGRIYERGPDGAEIDWGEITEWDPPGRLAYHWHIRRDRTEATNVELTFVDAGNGSTRVEIVHTGWERLGARAEEWRDANADGWSGLVPHYVAYLDLHPRNHSAG